MKYFTNEELYRYLEKSNTKLDLFSYLGYKNGKYSRNADKYWTEYYLKYLDINLVVFFLNKKQKINIDKLNTKYICERCNKPYLFKDSNSKRFCSKKCIGEYASSFVDKQKHQECMQQKFGLKNKRCIICDTIFKPKTAKVKVCSRSCASKLAYKTSLRNHPNSLFFKGGFREKSSRGKQGWYKGYFCNSQWELAYLIYCLDNNIKIERNKVGYKYVFENKEHLFYPDFIVNDKLVEIKNYWRPINDAKIAAVKQIKPITILYTSDLKEVFDYINTKYNKNKMHIYELYEQQYKGKNDMTKSENDIK